MRATAQDAPSGIVTVAEIERDYPDEWVLLEITHDQRHHHRIKGRLLAHAKDRAALLDAYHRFRAANPTAQTYQFFTGDVVPADLDAIVVL